MQKEDVLLKPFSTPANLSACICVIWRELAAEIMFFLTTKAGAQPLHFKERDARGRERRG